MKHTDKSTDTPNDQQQSSATASDSSADTANKNNAPPTLTDRVDDSASPTKDNSPSDNTSGQESTISADSDSPPPGSGSTPSAEATTQPPAKNKISKLAVLALLLILISWGALGYGYTWIQKLHGQMADQTAQLSQRLEQGSQSTANAERRATTLESQLQQARQQINSQSSNLNELQDRLTRAMQQISTIGTNSRRDWLLAEVEYLLRLANQRVLMENSPQGALALLQSADKILKETDDVSLYNVRKALARDVAALQTVPKLDVDGTFLRLAALNEQVEKLRLLPITDRHQLPDMLKQVTPDNVSDSWEQGMASAWSGAMDKLGSLIVIRHRDKPVKPLLSPEQHFFLQQNLHLMLEQAQLALLQGKQGAFDASLNKAGDWVAAYFQAEDSTTKALIQGINELKGTQVAPTLPDISGSLRTLKTYLAAQIDRKGAA